MANLILPPAWRLPESAVTPEDAWLGRRRFLQGLGVAGLSALAVGCTAAAGDPLPPTYAWDVPSVPRNPTYADPGPLRRITDERVAATYNNFYEFTTAKDKVWTLAGSLRPRPWTVEVGGRVHQPRTFDLDELLRTMPMEERVYRFRCVEAWSMVVPWIGFPLAKLLDAVEPMGDARFVRFVTLNDPRQMPGIRSQPWYPWPYFEALTMAEARNELAMLAVGIYGHALPNQHGAPIRLVTPWKYGFKNIKSVVKIELTTEQPPTFWNAISAEEYDFMGNVDPGVPHPRWSQATERVIPTGERIPTLKYNGYAEQVAGLYPT